MSHINAKKIDIKEHQRLIDLNGQFALYIKAEKMKSSKLQEDYNILRMTYEKVREDYKKLQDAHTKLYFKHYEDKDQDNKYIM
jgi:hypothetical protein